MATNTFGAQVMELLLLLETLEGATVDVPRPPAATQQNFSADFYYYYYHYYYYYYYCFISIITIIVIIYIYMYSYVNTILAMLMYSCKRVSSITLSSKRNQQGVHLTPVRN